MIDKETKEAVPVTAFLKAEQLAKDVAAGRPTPAAAASCRSSAWRSPLMRNYDPFKSPTHFKLTDLLKKFDKTFGATKAAEKGKYGKVEGDRTTADIAKRRADRWNFLFIAGMWFQDLFNYDFRRTEMCIIPYATQQGEISFCAYNTGIGWRNIIEKMHMTATLTKWYEEHGRHEIFAGNKSVPLASTEHSLKLNEEAVRGRRADRSRRSRDRQECARGKAARRASTRTSREGSGAPRGDGQAVPRSTCSRSSRRCRSRGSGGGTRGSESEGRSETCSPCCTSLPSSRSGVRRQLTFGAGGKPPALFVCIYNRPCTFEILKFSNP